MTALVTKNLPLLAGAPQGISKLRQLIRELAVHGLLLQQDATDAPANREQALLARGRVVGGAGRARKLRATSEGDATEPYSIPPSWQWCKLADLVDVLNGRAYKKEELLAAGTPVLRVGNLFTSNHWYYSDLVLDEDKYCQAGDLIFAWSASFGPFIWSGERVIYHYHIWKLRPHVEAAISKLYLSLFLQERTQAIKAAGHGVSMAHMTKEKMEALPVALPPLAEQHRIVAKVDELMALCDRMEARQQDAEAAHARLVQALLDSLTQARDAEEFQACWQRLAQQFQISFTTVEAVDKLKQVIRDVAVSGRLLAGSAGEASWEWSTLGAEVTGMDSGWSPACLDTPSPSEEVWGVLRTTAVQSLQYVQAENKALPSHLEPRPEAEVRAGDILFTRAGPMNRVAISCLVEATRPRLMLSDKIIRFRPKGRVLGSFMALCLNAGKTAAYLEQAKSGMAASQVNISQAKLKAAPIPVPPLDEQGRIVSAVTELLALCDQLKARIAAARAKHAQLAEALVAQAVAA